MSTKPNPYVGPRAFETGETLYGRERELRQLKSLLVAERIVLLHSPSGAGKTSLIQAGLLPNLPKSFKVLPVIRVNLEPPQEARSVAEFNRYTFSTLAALEEAQPESDRLSDAELAVLGLDSYIEKRLPPGDMVLIFDQFEEILTASPADREAKLAFFADLGAALRDPDRWALFAMREDYIGALDPYLRPIPGQLEIRYRLDLLAPESAKQAIQKPAQDAGVEFVDEIAQKLVDDLRVIQVQQPDGSFERVPGQHIEPVQMQVVCYNLWQSGAAEDERITLDDLQKVGSVDDALAAYYVESIKRAAASRGVEEYIIRKWFSEQLITPDGIRSQTLRGRDTTAGLPNRVLGQLENAHLIRGETRAGKTWYELAHDRLVEPVRKSNAAWFDANLSLLQKQAKLWDQQGRGEGLLLRGEALKDAEEEAASTNLNEAEKDFLAACRALRERERRERRRNTLMTILALGTTIAMIVAGFFYFQARAQTKIARIGKIDAVAAQSMFFRDKNFQLSLLLVVEAFNKLDEEITSTLAQSALLENSQANPRLEQFLNGNTGPVVSAIFSPDGAMLASGTYGQDILLWDMKSRQIMDRLSGHSNIVRSIDFSRDGSLMASGSQDTTIIIWDMKTRQLMGKLSGHSKSVLSVVFSPDGKTLASGSEDTTIILWNVKTRQIIHTLSGHSGIVRSVAFSPDGKTLASGSNDGTIILWDAKTGKPVDKPFIEPSTFGPNPVYGVAFSPDGKTLASGDYGKNVVLWNAKTGQPIYTLSGHSDKVRVIAFSPDGQTLASGSADKTIILWDVETGQLRDQLKGHSVLINSLSFSPDGSTLASGSGDTTIILWDMNPRQPLNRPLNGYTHFGPVLSIAFSPDGKTLASGSADATIMLWDVEKGQSIGDQPLIGHKDIVRSVAFSPDGRTLVSGSNDQTVILWDVEKRQAIVTLSGHSAPVTSVAFSPDGRILASGSEDTTVKLWNVEKGQAIGQPLSGHSTSVNSVAFSPDGKTLASGSGDKSIILWDVMTRKVIVSLSGHSVSINSVAFSPDGKTLASGSGDRTIILWDLKTRKAIVTLSGHLDSINSLAFSPDGKKLASGSVDQTIILWDVKTYQPIGSLSGNSAPIESIAFSPDSKTLASGSFDVILWDASEQLWVNASCQRAGRNFTRNEWDIYFPNESYRATCPEFPLEPAAILTGTP
jgi:WD40 repeat protein